jgi:hypothetical protein
MHDVLHRVKHVLVVGGMASALVLGARVESTLAQADNARRASATNAWMATG